VVDINVEAKAISAKAISAKAISAKAISAKAISAKALSNVVEDIVSTSPPLQPLEVRHGGVVSLKL
jgi:hypothetical protein